MYYKTRPVCSERPVLEPMTKKDGSPLVVAIDQYNAQSFNLGFNGFPANDLTLLERAQTLAECQLIAQRLQEVKVANPNLEGKSDADIIKMIKPRVVQSPAEVERYLDYYYNNVIEPSLAREEIIPPSVDVDAVETKTE